MSASPVPQPLPRREGGVEFNDGCLEVVSVPNGRFTDHVALCTRHGWSGGIEYSRRLAELAICPFCYVAADGDAGRERYQVIQARRAV